MQEHTELTRQRLPHLSYHLERDYAAAKQNRKEAMNTSFKPSEFNKQAAASLEMMDVEGATERVQAILHPQPGPTLTPAVSAHAERPLAPQTQPASPAERAMEKWSAAMKDAEENRKNRKPRSDKGIPKVPRQLESGLAQADEVTLRLSLNDARQIPTALPPHLFWIATSIQDQIIAQLQKRLDALQRAK